MRLQESIVSLYLHRQVLWDMAFKQFKAKYAGSTLGIFGAVLNPLLTTLIVSFVFSVIFKVTTPHFSFFVLSGMFPWMFFSGALSDATTSILAQQNILRQFHVPREILPLSCVLSVFLNFLAGWLVILPIFIFFHPGVFVLAAWLPLIFLLSLIFVSGLGLLFSLLNVFARDFGNLVGALMMFWLWVTPVFYSQDMVPEKFRWLCDMNPLTSFVALYRDVLFWARMPQGSLLLSACCWGFISLLLGLVVFARLESQLIKRL